MSTWLEQFAARLNDINSTRGAQMRGGSEMDNIYSLLSKRIYDANIDKSREGLLSSPTHTSAVGDIWGGIKSGGGRVLDVISRGNYMSANFIKSLSEDELKAKKQGHDVGIFGQGVDYNWTDALKAAGRGLAGKDKTTFSDVFRETGTGNKTSAVAGFVADVGLDPLTYIGPGAVKGIVKGGFKVAGKEVPKFGRAKNLLTTEKVLMPDQKAAQELVEKGTTTVKESNTAQILNKMKPAEKPAPFDVVNDVIPPSRQIEAPPASKFIVDPSGTTTYKPWQQSTKRFAAEAHLRSLTSTRDNLLKGIEAKRYGPDVAIEAPIKSVTTQVPEKYLENVVETLPKRPTVDVIEEGIKQLHTTAAKGPGESVKIFGKDGKPIPKPAATEGIPQGAAWDKLSEAEQQRIAREYAKGSLKNPGVYSSVKLDTLRKAVAEGGKLPDVIKNAHIRVGNKLVPLQEHIAKIHETALDHDLFGEASTVTKQVEKERLVEQVSHQKLNPTELLAWSLKHQDVLDKEDMLAIRRAVGLGPKAVDTVIAKIKDKTLPRDFSSVEELTIARKNKLLTARGEAALKYRLSQVGARGPKDLEAKIERAAKAAREAIENPTPANKLKAAKTAVEAKDATAASKTVTKAGNIEADIWTTPAVQEAVQTKVAKAAKGDVTDFAKPKAVLHAEQAKVVTEALRKVNKSEFVDPLDRAKYGFETNTGVKRTRPTYGAGKGRAHRGFNKFSQLSLGKEIISGASRLVRGTTAEMRPAAMYDTAMPMLLAAEAGLREAGIPLILGKGSTGLPMSIHDVLSALPRPFVEKYYFTPQTSLGITQLADIAEQFIQRNLGNLDDASVINNVAELLGKGMGKKGLQSPLTKSLNGNVASTVDDFMNAFTEAAPKLNEALTSNSAAALIKVGDETKALTDEAISAFNEVVTNPKYSAGAVMDAALKINQKVDSLAAERAIPVSGEAKVLAEQAAAAHVADTLPLAAVATAAKGAEKFAKATTTSQVAKIAEELAKSADVEAHTLMKEVEVDAFDLGVNAEFGLGVGMFRAFAPHLGNEVLRPILTARNSVAQSMAKQFTRQLGKVNAMHSTDELREAFHMLQEGREISTPAMDSLNGVLKELFNIDGSSYGLISRNGISVDHLYSKFKHFGIGDNIKLDRANIDNSWKSWKIDDPLDFASKFHAAVNSAVADRQIGADIGRMFGRNTPMDDGTKWVKVIDPQGKSRIASLIDRNKYYPEDIVRQMHMIDKTMAELAKPTSANKFLKTLDSALHAYKAGVTIYRPGHHTRNLIGDMWLSSMDGVAAPAYKKAFAVLGTRPSQYQDFDALRALQDAYAVEGTAPKSVLNLTFKGKQVSFSPDEVYRMAFDNGVLPDYSVLEDVAFGSTKDQDKIATTLERISPFKGKVHKVATQASEYRDHYVRIAHFIHAMEQTPLKGGSLQEALQNASHMAGNRVRKWHPDGSDLSDFERRYARRTILFYSWVRKAIPLVLESMVTRPGRVMLYPKAMQNIAAQNGIDLAGFGNPFPDDQLFPSYIADSVQGPIAGQPGSYVGIKPGIPAMDIADDFMASPLNTLRTIMGSANPGIKIPAEVASGNQLRTGTPIMDKTDYIDSQIPGATYIDKLAGGRSLSSGFTQNTRVAPSNVGYEGNPNTPGLGGTDFLNWLLGLGITDYSKPSSIKSAQFEQKQRGR